MDSLMFEIIRVFGTKNYQFNYRVVIN